MGPECGPLPLFKRNERDPKHGPLLCIVDIRVLQQGTQIKDPYFGSPIEHETT